MGVSIPSDTASIRIWAALPRELLDLILHKLILLPHYIRFGVVCKEWLSVALEQKQKQKRVNIPMLFIPNPSKHHRNLYSIWEDKVYDHQFPIPYRKRCSGSSHGWWAVAEKDLSITLLNPFSGKTIHLPPVMDVPEHYRKIHRFRPEFLIFKVVLSCDPILHPDNYEVVAIYDENNKLALIRSGEQSWNQIDKSFRTVLECQFCKGRLYASNSHNQLIVIDYCSNATAAPVEYLVIEKPRNYLECSWLSYLVESLDGDLLLVRRIYFNDGDDRSNYEVTVGFKIYKLVMKHSSEKGKAKWVEIESLGNSALFLGNNQSICISATSIPNCQPNSIYYTDDCKKWHGDCSRFEPKDMGIFDLESKQIRKYYEIPDSLRYNRPAAVWILPILS